MSTSVNTDDILQGPPSNTAAAVTIELTVKNDEGQQEKRPVDMEQALTILPAFEGARINLGNATIEVAETPEEVIKLMQGAQSPHPAPQP